MKKMDLYLDPNFERSLREYRVVYRVLRKRFLRKYGPSIKRYFY